MILISHRGNLYGPKKDKENKPNYVEEAIEAGFDVEVDVRYDVFSDKWYLGHDDFSHEISFFWLEKHKKYLWIHCKDLESLYKFSLLPPHKDFNYFWHQKDDYTLTSKRYIWTYPGKKHTSNSVMVLLGPNKKINELKMECFGLCSDYVGELKCSLPLG